MHISIQVRSSEYGTPIRITRKANSIWIDTIMTRRFRRIAMRDAILWKVAQRK